LEKGKIYIGLDLESMVDVVNNNFPKLKKIKIRNKT
jgi:hypothetical protein